MRLFILLCGLVLWTAASAARGVPHSAPSQLCLNAVAAAEHAQRTPDRLLVSIGRVESGRPDPRIGSVQPWPWTINAEGQGHFFDTKEQAIAAVEALQARGVRSIDVGCMQVNLMHHPHAFASLAEAFEPHANARYAARFLIALHRELGDWQRAIAAYHSQTAGIGTDYARRVLAAWGRSPAGLPPVLGAATVYTAFATSQSQYRAFAPASALFAAFADPATLPLTLRGYGGLPDREARGREYRR